MREIGNIMDAMIDYYAGDIRRVNHFLKVYGFARSIAEMEQLSPEDQFVLEITALMHDIGIKNSEIKYGSAAGPYQETEGPPEARIILEKLGLPKHVIGRVCWLIAHHHTYRGIEGRDHAILIEADFLVNADEDNMSQKALESVREKIFTTKTGRKYFEQLYPGTQADART